ncbi:gas2 domain containing protein [Grosmannia clavigera kw1407]|uniref:Gas2 domain containing protein n=1 Tax=Grosmannia clavigera (strain kw1407 / UAMH 11150) TaxID=655863 RepID=F0X8V0_GROCL|nr:gas2 domain containing protein [Grosmannia clavigera kw1407]EFX06003.1 gas2 domain containing protein [Grosmannia clavigera kw1407]
MSGFPVLPAPTARLSAPSHQYYRSMSGSPIRQHHQLHVDELVSRLAPPTAAQSLRFPSGPLKRCLESAPSSDQSFAMRAAIASTSIYEWWDELSRWSWPSGGGSVGFEEPTASRQIIETITGGQIPTVASPPSPPTSADPMTPESQITRTSSRFGSVESKGPGDELWIGSLPASDVFRYESRVAEIQREIEYLEVEDMKHHVLHHHILPLSPPSTPPSDSMPQRSAPVSAAKVIRMDDLTAVVTAIVLQALPLLSKLHRLLDTWHIRTLVLKKIPTFLDSLNAAEIAIQSAWDAVQVGSVATAAKDLTISESQVLRRDEVSAMKSIVERKVSRAAQAADYMLDVLDGWDDTVPEAWIDRIDLVEKDYAEWVAFCERKICESEWKTPFHHKSILSPPQQLPSTPSFTDVTYETDSPVSDVLDTKQPSSDKCHDRILESPAGSPPENMHISVATTVVGYQTPPSLSPRSSIESIGSEPSLPMRRTSPEPTLDSPLPIFVSSHKERGTEPEIGAADDDGSVDYDQNPSSSPPEFHGSIRSPATFRDMPTVAEMPGEEISGAPKTPIESSFIMGDYDNDGLDIPTDMHTPHSRRTSFGSEDDQLQQQISSILESIPAKIHLSSQPSTTPNQLNPPDFKMPRKARTNSDGARSTSAMSSRSMTPSFLLAPAFSRNPRPRHQRSNRDIKLYHLSRSTGEPPIKLFIRPVGESGERVMVRVGGGWADLSEYLKEYASHHSRRSKSGNESKIEIRDLPPTLTASMAMSSALNRFGSSPPSRPESSSPGSPATPPLIMRKTRMSVGEESKVPRTPLVAVTKPSETPLSEVSTVSRSSSRLSWTEEGSSLGMSGPRAKNIEMSEESKAWVESVKEKVRIASGEHVASDQMEGKFGEIGKAGGTKRVFRRG